MKITYTAFAAALLVAGRSPVRSCSAFGIKTGTLVREARRLCPAVVPVQANHRLYTEYHERILKAVDTCLPVEKVCSIDEMACRLMGIERQVSNSRDLALKVKRALREQVGECLTCSQWRDTYRTGFEFRRRIPQGNFRRETAASANYHGR